MNEYLDVNRVGNYIAETTNPPSYDQKQVLFRPKIESVSDNDEDTLCSTCASLRIEELFDMTPDSDPDYEEVMELGGLPDSLATSDCALCRLLFAVKVDFDYECRSEYTLVKCLWRMPRPLNSDEGSSQKSDPWMPCLCVVRLPKVKLADMGHRIIDQSEDKGLIAQVNRHDTQLTRCCHAVEEVPQTIYNFEFLKDWINLCDNTHGSACSLTAGEDDTAWPKNLTLIACRERRLVPAVAWVKYAALSYVWGQTASLGPVYRFDQHQLPNHLPKTIQDALLVTQNCGIDYLWVDRYCINQDSVQKHDQIQQMDLIYQNAYLTIVDATGDDAVKGLSGVSRQRSAHVSVRLKSRTLGTTLSYPDYWRYERPCPWVTRGWTYQEAFFSRRLVLFTEEQMQWQCHSALYQESMPTIHRSGSRILGKRASNALHLWDYLREYSDRDLSFESDAMSAISGVFNQFERSEEILRFFVGIPILADVVDNTPNNPLRKGQYRTLDMMPHITRSAKLADGMQWRNIGKHARRSIWPSWSWLGWSGRLSHKFQFPANIDESLRIQVEDSTDELIDFDTAGIFITDFPSTPYFIRVESQTMAIRTEKQDASLDSAARGFSDHSYMGVSAIFEDLRYRLEMVIFPQHRCIEGRALSPHWTSRESDEGVLGLVFEDYTMPLLPNENEMPFILLVQDLGSHFERVGHMLFHPSSMRLRQKSNGNSIVPDETFMKSMIPWSLCFGATQRRKIRLG